MDSHKDNGSDESAPAPDTSHLAVPAKKPKKSSKKLIALLVVVIAVVASATGGGLYYQKTQNDQKAADAAAAKTAQSNQKSPEDEITSSLTDSVHKQIKQLEQSDDKSVIEDSTAAAQQAGGNIDETGLKE